MSNSQAQFEVAQSLVHRTGELEACRGWTDGMRPYLTSEVEKLERKALDDEEISEIERTVIRRLAKRLRALITWPERTKKEAIALLESRK